MLNKVYIIMHCEPSILLQMMSTLGQIMSSWIYLHGAYFVCYEHYWFSQLTNSFYYFDPFVVWIEYLIPQFEFFFMYKFNAIGFSHFKIMLRFSSISFRSFDHVWSCPEHVVLANIEYDWMENFGLNRSLIEPNL